MMSWLTEMLTCRLKVRAMRDKNLNMIGEVIRSNYRNRMQASELLAEKQRADRAEKQLNDMKRKIAETLKGLSWD